MNDKLQKKPTLTLLFELMCQEHARNLPKEFSNYFDIDLEGVIKELSRRYAKDMPTDFDSLSDIFISEESPLSIEHKEKLARMKIFRDGKIKFDDIFSEVMSEIKGAE